MSEAIARNVFDGADAGTHAPALAAYAAEAAARLDAMGPERILSADFVFPVPGPEADGVRSSGLPGS
ncbi:ubiquinol-cytochrome C chaperone family protein [Methylobrevis pamukkalensis]|uniref:ubiquinol-cytochrome C chaperone family protein n=1 Tax=Methylobrevis pamukkalensis TaxID=1439726 RepID=UPI003CCA0BC7